MLSIIFAAWTAQAVVTNQTCNSVQTYLSTGQAYTTMPNGQFGQCTSDSKVFVADGYQTEKACKDRLSRLEYGVTVAERENAKAKAQQALDGWKVKVADFQKDHPCTKRNATKQESAGFTMKGKKPMVFEKCQLPDGNFTQTITGEWDSYSGGGLGGAMTGPFDGLYRSDDALAALQANLSALDKPIATLTSRICFEDKK